MALHQGRRRVWLILINLDKFTSWDELPLQDISLHVLYPIPEAWWHYTYDSEDESIYSSVLLLLAIF